jgi:hypothetical protein
MLVGNRISSRLACRCAGQDSTAPSMSSHTSNTSGKPDATGPSVQTRRMSMHAAQADAATCSADGSFVDLADDHAEPRARKQHTARAADGTKSVSPSCAAQPAGRLASSAAQHSSQQAPANVAAPAKQPFTSAGMPQATAAAYRNVGNASSTSAAVAAALAARKKFHAQQESASRASATARHARCKALSVSREVHHHCS